MRSGDDRRTVDVPPVLLETTAARDEKAKLKKHFGRFDMLFFLICTLVGVDTLGQVASNGPEGFTWLVVLAVLFFVPYALLTAELGAAFTDEGGCYVWTKLAWGRFIAAVTSVMYWLSNPVWMGGLLCITAVTTFNTFFGDLGNVGQYLFSLVVHLVRRLGRGAVVRHRQVDPDARRLGADRAAELLHDQRDRLRVQEWPAHAEGHGLQALATRCSSRSCRCCSSTSSASNCPTRRATR